jgi:hypothetical protein
MRFRKIMTMMSDAILELECLQISSSEFIDTARQLVSAGKGLWRWMKAQAPATSGSPPWALRRPRSEGAPGAK